MGVPNPLQNLPVLAVAAVASVFLIASRFVSVSPLLYALRNGHRVSHLTAINLSQMSEFSLVIASIGMTLGHIRHETLSIIIFVFVLTSILSTYMIQYSDPLQKRLTAFLQRLGIKDIGTVATASEAEVEKDIVILGFYRVASSFLREVLDRDEPTGAIHGVGKENVVVIDFNPEVHQKLNTYGVKMIYGDIGHLDTLHHAGIHNAKIVLSTIPDNILVGTDNLRLMKHIQSLCPHAKILVTAENPQSALQMYAEGAAYVLMPRVLAAQHLLEMTAQVLHGETGEIEQLKQAHIEQLQAREEIVS
jgi:hypothetical protein